MPGVVAVVVVVDVGEGLSRSGYAGGESTSSNMVARDLLVVVKSLGVGVTLPVVCIMTNKINEKEEIFQ